MKCTSCLLLCILAAGMAWSAPQLGPPVDLLEGLERGQIWAQFWGGGDTGVNGVVGRGETGPRGVDISPGTQFWAQTTGRQGQTSLGRTQVDLSSQRYARVWIPTACTNFNLLAPTEEHAMNAFPCPSEDMARLCALPELWGFPRPSIQLAVWAIANDPPPARLRGYLRDQVRASDNALTEGGIVSGAATLLANAGLDPVRFAMFR
ncbi:MAG: hypothetical protein QM473_11345 [Acidobacteriota bacterium]|jgi:hypothetical protein|nr:hypothetical protein [Acidobacteriota bacterium]